MNRSTLTPLMMFLLILIVLVITIYLKNLYYVEGVENMFNDNGQFSEFILAEYSNTSPLTQLTETIFYDKKNGNIVESIVEWSNSTGTDTGNGNATDTTGSVPGNGTASDADDTTSNEPASDTEDTTEGNTNMTSSSPTLKQLIITLRSGAESYIYDVTSGDKTTLPTKESTISSLSPSYTSWSYVSQSKFAPATTVFYIPWKQKTYLALFENKDNKLDSRGIFCFSNDKNAMFSPNSIDINGYTNTTDDKNNKYVQIDKYGDHDLYQVDKYVLYDIPTSHLILRKENDEGSIVIYNGNGDIIQRSDVQEKYKSDKTHENQEKYAEIKGWFKLDGQGNNIVLYIKDNENTIVSIIGFESSSVDSLILRNVKRFTLHGTDQAGNVEKPTSSSDGKCDKTPYSDKSSSNSDGSKANSDDYVLKTQIVPPVCPSCPMCPGNTTCTNCGGTGGSGTVDTNKKSVVKDDNGNIVSKTVGEVGSVANSVVGLAKDTVDGGVGLAKDAVDGGVDLTKDAVGGTVGLAKDAVGGTVGLAKDAVGGTVGLAKDAVGGTVGLAKDAVGGVFGLAKDIVGGASGAMETNPGQQNGGMSGQYYGTNNNYSRYGMLPATSSNFIPRTANFNAFA
jgi:hypothetical protein